MSLEETIRHDTEAAQKSRDTLRLQTLRMLRAALKNVAIEKHGELTDEDVVTTIRTEVKRLKDSMQDFERGGRADLLQAAEDELRVLAAYLPAMMAEDGVREIVRAKLAGSPRDPKQMGKLMGEIMSAHKGKIDGTMLREIMKQEMGST